MEDFDAGGVTGIVWRRVAQEHEARAEAVMRQLMLLSRQYEGYLGSEIFPPIPGVQDAYVVLYRFSRGRHFRRWLESTQRQELVLQISELLLEPQREFFFVHSRRQAGTASSVFAIRIRPDKQAEFQEWRVRIFEEMRRWKGFLGSESFDHLESTTPEFIVVIRFESREELDAWLHSDVRKAFLKESHKFIDQFTVRRIGSGFEGWFDNSENKNPPAPWRQMLVILAALFPVILTLRSLLSPLFSVLPTPIAFLILLVIDLSLLTFFIMPRFTRLMNFWLRPGPDFAWKNELAGWGILLGIIGLTLCVSLLV